MQNTSRQLSFASGNVGKTAMENEADWWPET